MLHASTFLASVGFLIDLLLAPPACPDAVSFVVMDLILKIQHFLNILLKLGFNLKVSNDQNHRCHSKLVSERLMVSVQATRSQYGRIRGRIPGAGPRPSQNTPLRPGQSHSGTQHTTRSSVSQGDQQSFNVNICKSPLTLIFSV